MSRRGCSVSVRRVGLSLAGVMDASVGETVALAVRRLRQDRIAEELRARLTPEEETWLGADLG